MTDYLSLAEATAILAAAPTNWHDGHQAVSVREGWALFNLTEGATWFGDVSLDRCDEPELWDGCELKEPLESDYAAMDLCRSKPDSATHCLALKIHHAADSWRFHTWGAEWVDSRIGPT